MHPDAQGIQRRREAADGEVRVVEGAARDAVRRLDRQLKDDGEAGAPVGERA